MNSIKLNCKALKNNKNFSVKEKGNIVELYHKNGDPKNVLRIKAILAGLEVELYPSKGLSVGESKANGKPIFWDSIIGMPDPDTLDLWSDEIAVNGEPAKGFTFLKTFNGGIELYGLNNWGMPIERNGKLRLLHGETSNIPLDFVEISLKKNTVIISGSFFYRTFTDELGGNKPWYKRGQRLVKITRNIKLSVENNPTIRICDVFENVSPYEFFVDWGYHITFKPEVGSKIIIPSKHHEVRFNGDLPDDIHSWQPPKENNSRREEGIIHKGLDTIDIAGLKLNYITVSRPTLGDIRVLFTPSPYTQSWKCSGGAFTEEFKYVNTNDPLYEKNWDGIGIEIGASALDHDGNTDPNVTVSKPLKKGEKITNYIIVECL